MTTTNPSTRQPLSIVESEPERLFRVERVTEQGTVVRTSMATGTWLQRDGAQISGGVLGVLLDNVLGYGVMVERPLDNWSVSSEISIDMCRRIESGTRLSGQARPVFADSRGAVTSGEVFDDQGRLVALGRQHGRFVDHLPDVLTNAGPAEPMAPAADRGGDPGTIFDLLDLRPRLTDGGAVLELLTTSAVRNPLNNMHGGVTLCLADLTAITALEASGQPFETASIHVAYVRPIPVGTSVTFTATVTHAGRSFAVARVDARNGAGKVCASATVTAAAR